MVVLLRFMSITVSKADYKDCHKGYDAGSVDLGILAALAELRHLRDPAVPVCLGRVCTHGVANCSGFCWSLLGQSLGFWTFSPCVSVFLLTVL